MSKVTLYETPINNHGCRGFEVILEIITDELAVVVGGQSCSSCWQVGHDYGNSSIEIGTIVSLPDKVDPNRIIWYKEHSWAGGPALNLHLDWKLAARPSGYSHNELVIDRGEETLGLTSDGVEVIREREPQPDCTLVRPSELIKTDSSLPQVKAAYDLAYKRIGFSEFKSIVRENS